MKNQILILLLLPILITSGLQAQNVKQDKLTCFPKGSLSLRTNTVPWLMLTPNVGVEYKAGDNIGLLVDGSWAHWKLNTPDKYWRIWNVAPQVRYYIGKLKDNYTGLQYTMGEYNLTGNQARYIGGGLTLGHQFHLAKNLMVDLGISAGYLYLHDKEKYKRINEHDYRIKARSSHGYWGPTGLSATFIWKIN